ncbi:hypothetical protein ACFLSX_01575 [Calditrichota bacterium]
MIKNEIVITIIGGMLDSVFSNNQNSRYILVDYDNISSGDPFPTEGDSQIVDGHGINFKDMLEKVKSGK